MKNGSSLKSADASRRIRLAAFLCAAVAISAAVAYGVVLWEDRPLWHAEKQLSAGGQAREVLSSLDEFLNEHPNHSRAWALRARAVEQLGRWEEADAIYSAVGAESFEELHAWARVKLHLQRWTSALPLLEHCDRLRPDDPDVLHELTACLERLGEPQKALVIAERLAKQPAHRHRALFLIGTLHQTMGNARLAVAAWGEVLQLRPQADDLQVSPAEFLTEYGRELLNSGRAADAFEPLERSISLQDSAAARLLLGNACQQTGRTDEAVGHWKTALELDSTDDDARVQLADAAIRRRDFDEALDWLKPLAAQTVLKSSTAYLLQRVHAALGQRAEAEAWQRRAAALREKESRIGSLRHALATSPHAFWSRVVLAYRFAEQKNWEQAQMLVQALRREAPQEKFLIDLEQAIQREHGLPALEDIPQRHF